MQRPADPPPEILFTFDDGPSLERTPRVLDILDQHHVKAVFFVNGYHFQGTSVEAERARALVREIFRRGHAVGNHTVNHLFLCGKRGLKVAADEIERNAQLITETIGVRPLLYRTPYGAHCKTLSKTLGELGVTNIPWDIDPQDWRVKNTKLIRDYVVRHIRTLKGRAIILLHDVHEDAVRALPQVLRWIDEENRMRVTQGLAPVRILDYHYLLPKQPLLPTAGGIAQALIDQVPLSTLRSLVQSSSWFGLTATLPWIS